MAASLLRSTARTWLYRTAWWRVISGVLILGALSLTVPAQVGHATKKNKGPRALGLIELAPNGKANLIPIAIMVDGKYYDAGAYKAAPVPMALWSETVYEGVLTGVSQGLFTVTGALQRKDASEAVEWMAEGTWQSASSLKARAAVVKKPVVSVPRGMNDDEGPPVLRRAGNEKPKPPEPTTPLPTPPASSTSTTPAATPPPASSPASPSPQEQAQADKPPDDSDRPTLKRGQAGAASAAAAQQKTVPASPAKTANSVSPSVPASAASSGTQSGAAAASQVQLIPGISDANGPDLLAYAYNMKPEEEKEFRKRMLEIAADEVRTRAGQPSVGGAGTTPAAHASSRSKAAAGKFAQPEFEDVQLRVFDLSNTNEPELVLTAKARMPQRPHEKQTPNGDVQYMITLVAREDVNGDFHKALVSITDTQHLDAIPRLELIDAVDVDGDGRGELLFRQVSEAASAFVVYSVIGDRLYPLFQGTPGS
jgi:hypothetical protein